MIGRNVTRVSAAVLGLLFYGTIVLSQTEPQRSPRWSLAKSPPDPGGKLTVVSGGKVIIVQRPVPSDSLGAACHQENAKYCGGEAGSAMRDCLTRNAANLSNQCKVALAAIPRSVVPACSYSPVCDNRRRGTRQELERVEWEQTMGYTYAYPIDLPEGGGGVVAVAVTSKGELWVLQRNAVGNPQLFEFDRNYKMMRAIGDDVIGHQEKAHGMAVDAQDNVWICDANGATIEEINPDGKLIRTFGVKGHRGDWDEAKHQLLLWQPMDVAFAPNGDIYIGEGHANESPNDTDSDDPTNNIGAARVIHLDKSGNFINQWYGNSVGQGKFSMAHGIAVDPRDGNIWIGDREQYRLVVYTADGKFVKTIQMRNLTCAVAFDPNGNLWVATGHDGQLLKIDRDGHVVGAVGNGPGIGTGEFAETNYMAWDKQGNIYTGDTDIGRVTEIVASRK